MRLSGSCLFGFNPSGSMCQVLFGQILSVRFSFVTFTPVMLQAVRFSPVIHLSCSCLPSSHLSRTHLSGSLLGSHLSWCHCQVLTKQVPVCRVLVCQVLFCQSSAVRLYSVRFSFVPLPVREVLHREVVPCRSGPGVCCVRSFKPTAKRIGFWTKETDCNK